MFDVGIGHNAKRPSAYAPTIGGASILSFFGQSAVNSSRQSISLVLRGRGSIAAKEI